MREGFIGSTLFFLQRTILVVVYTTIRKNWQNGVYLAAKAPYVLKELISISMARATNYYVLGCSIPNILDLGVSSPIDYIRAFYQLLTEYEIYQSQNHEHHGNAHTSRASVVGLRLTSSSVRIPKLFSRPKPHRGSTATTAPSLSSLSSISPQESPDSLLERTLSLS